MYGAAQRTTPGNPLVFEEGSNWTIPMHACATAVKASVKEVSFNQTESGLAGTAVTQIKEKPYADPSQQPLWAVEDSGFNNTEIQPLWGIVTPGSDAHVSMKTKRGPSLYLPGYNDAFLASSFGKPTYDNLPAARFHTSCSGVAYSVKWSSLTPGVDYTGYTNMAMWAKWQELSKSADNASQILDLIWTDTAASLVVGTKGTLGANNAGTPIPITVLPLTTRVSYHWPYGIPAILVGLLFVLFIVAALVSACLGRASISSLRRHIYQTSVGRVLTVMTHPDEGNIDMRARDWSRMFGGKVMDLSPGQKPVTVTHVEVEPELKGVQDWRANDGSQSQPGSWPSMTDGSGRPGGYQPVAGHN